MIMYTDSMEEKAKCILKDKTGISQSWKRKGGTTDEIKHFILSSGSSCSLGPHQILLAKYYYVTCQTLNSCDSYVLSISHM